jgi:hypothetical protein
MVALWGLWWDDTTGTAALARLGRSSGLRHRLGWGDTLRFLVPLIALSTMGHPSERKRKPKWKLFTSQYICTVLHRCRTEQGCGSVFIFYRSGSGSSAFMTKNLKKNYSWIFFFFFFSKTAIYLSLGLHKVCPSYRRSLQLSKEAIQHFKTWTFTNFFLLLWVIFALLDPDPDSESGSTDPTESGSGSAILVQNSSYLVIHGNTVYYGH